MKSNLGLLHGLCIGVTGGAGHLGRTIALRLAEEGANIMICGRTESKLKAVKDLAEHRGMVDQVA
ncbi:MAG: SDR family NAD(P)-dependent oxidoreductase, partial [Moorea sp. SIO3I7]|nr:SDR family NAD(P)-dependent oxidoreductase [Moorena sp. SIO3I7]